MPTEKLIPISSQQNQTQFGPNTDYAVARPGETTAQTIARAAAGTATIIDVVDPRDVVGQYSYNFSHPGQDFRGEPFADTPAPDLVDDALNRTYPRLLGNYYELDNQTALNTMLLGRFQPFTTHSSKLIVWGGEAFSAIGENDLIFSRGWTALAESTPYSYQLTTNKLSILFQGVTGYAHFASDALIGVSGSDPVYPWLVGMRDHGYLIVDQNACTLFAKAIFSYIMADSSGAGILSFTPNFEDATASPMSSFSFQKQIIYFEGYLCEGMRLATIEWNQQNGTNIAVPMPVIYDNANITPISYFIYQIAQDADGLAETDIGDIAYSDPEPGLPLYFNKVALNTAAFYGGQTKNEPIGNTNPLSNYLKLYGGYAGQAEYQRYVWPDETYFEKNPDGSKKTVTINGVTNYIYRTDTHVAIINGQATPIVPIDAYNQMNMRYTRIQQAITEWHFRSGGIHNPYSNQRQTGWEKLKLCQWFRADLEYKNDPLYGFDLEGDGLNVGLNHRTHQNEELELDVIVAYLLRDCLRIFMASGQSVLVQGQQAQNGYNPNFSKTPYEIFTKALHRWSEFNFLFDHTFQVVSPYLYIFHNRTDTNQYDPKQAFEKKPVILAIMPFTIGGKALMGLIWSYPAMDIDVTPIDLICWFNKSGNRSYGYKVHLTRQTGVEFWCVDPFYGDSTPSQLLFQFTDYTGVKQTVTGDYRDQAISPITTHPTPPPILDGSITN